MATYSECLLGLCAVVFVFIRTGSSTEQINLAALLQDKTILHESGAGAVGPKLLTKYGSIQGLMVDKNYIFYGIPFANPPVGAYRWKAPRRVTPWRGLYDATYPRAACMQACIGPLSDECPKKVGVLNVFVPLSVNFTSPALKLLPVMVWIHGGDFITGSASKPLYDSRYISNFTHTVVVSVAYRLSSLFLSSS